MGTFVSFVFNDACLVGAMAAVNGGGSEGEGIAFIWDAFFGDCIGSLPCCGAVMKTSKTNLVATAIGDCNVAIYRLTNQENSIGKKYERLHILEGHEVDIRDIEFCPTAKCIATCADDCITKIWTVRSGLLIHSIYTGAPVLRLCFNTDGTGVFLASLVGDLSTVRVPSGERLWCASDAHRGGIKCLVVNKSGTLVATGGFDGNVKVLESAAGSCLFSAPSTYLEHDATEECGFDTDGHRRFVAAYREHVRCVPIRSVAFSASSELLVGGQVATLWHTGRHPYLHFVSRELPLILRLTVHCGFVPHRKARARRY